MVSVIVHLPKHFTMFVPTSKQHRTSNMTLSMAKYNESLMLSYDLIFKIQSKPSMTRKESNQDQKGQ